MTEEIPVTECIHPEPGSFRDPSGQVYRVGDRVFRGVDERTSSIYRELVKQSFFARFVEQSLVIGTKEANPPVDLMTSSFVQAPWATFLEHAVVPFVTYPYEWTFSMLRDAALLQLRIIEDSLVNGWTLKDATPFNIQWVGSRPLFIDLPSFEPREDEERWLGYRQFCAMYLTPLLLKTYLNVDHTRILRSNLEGISASEARKMFRGVSRFRRGVLSHVVLPAIVEESIAKRERDGAPAKERKATKQSEAMVVGLVQSLTRLVKSLPSKIEHTDWSEYGRTHSYEKDEMQKKIEFVRHCASRSQRNMVWDIGCNTGAFSSVCAPFSKSVISIDGDHDAVEQLYLAEKVKDESNILPLVMDLSNISPAQGWAGKERRAFDQRGKPDLIVCLALIHHIRISANIPISLFVDWLRSLECEIVIEFVDRHDEMVEKLLTNKKEVYDDYSRMEFERLIREFYRVEAVSELKGGRRVMYHLVPRS